MTQITLNIQDNKLGFFLELIKNFDFVQVDEVPTIDAIKTKKGKLSKEQQEFVDGLKSALKEVELHRQGKKKLKTIDQLLNEL